MHYDNGQLNKTGKFELPGSYEHYAPSMFFVVTNMRLSVRADFKTKKIICREVLSITVNRDINEISLDASELHVRNVYEVIRKIKKDGGSGNTDIDSSNTENYSDFMTQNLVNLNFRVFDDRLIINTGMTRPEGSAVEILIEYDAVPRVGVYFIEPDQYYKDKNPQLWTQGETTQSRHWFACIDHPLCKFSSQISITVPYDFIAISNGILVRIEDLIENGEKLKTFYYSEPNAHPAYLISMVIGRFYEIKEKYKDKLDLTYYVPHNFQEYAKSTFEHTAEIMEFFEDYFGVPYPYAKYSQVAVEDFIYGGMENSSCTTLTLDTLHDEKAHIDFTSDHLVSHELAHQWFGDLVTCGDWQHIWLNEGFATYCEALYWERSRGRDEFHYYVMQTADDYIEEASSRYQRPIVTNVYKHPDDLFDRHAYEKAGIVIHMLRNLIGEKYFRRALRRYLQEFANSTAQTDQLRRIFENESSMNLEKFFNQWIKRSGHPSLKVFISIESNAINVKVEQSEQDTDKQEKFFFEFPLELKVVFENTAKESDSPKRGSSNSKIFVIDVKGQETVFYYSFTDSTGAPSGVPKYCSVDPEFKILKDISIKCPKEMLISQLGNGNTIVERVEACRALRDYSSFDAIEALRKAITDDPFWGVSSEAAAALGSIKTLQSYQALKESLEVARHPKVRRAIIKAIGEYRKVESLKFLDEKLYSEESYFVQAEIIKAIGKTRDRSAIGILKNALDIPSFQFVISQGAIGAMKDFTDEQEILDLLIEKSKLGNPYRVREAATFTLGSFVFKNPDISEHLKILLTDSWFRVRINACRALAYAEDSKAIDKLQWVSEHDIDHRVRRVAEECIILIRKAAKSPQALEKLQDDIDKMKSKNLELLQRMDRFERGTK